MLVEIVTAGGARQSLGLIGGEKPKPVNRAYDCNITGGKLYGFLVGRFAQ